MSRTPKLGAQTCQCATCGLYFTGTTAFDRHRIPGTGRCVPPADVGLVLRDSGAWGWEPMSDEARERIARLRKWPASSSLASRSRKARNAPLSSVAGLSCGKTSPRR